MYKILEKDDLAASVFRYVFEAKDIAKKARAGQFVIIRLDEKGERIPITIADMDADKGTITLYVQAVGKTTIQLSQMKAGDSIQDLVGPLGEPSHIEKFGTVVSIGGGFGIAAIHPIVREYKNAGNKTISIIGARNKELLILENEMNKISDEVRIATDDGSYGKKGLVTDVLKDMIKNNEKIDLVLAIGPLIMMKAVADVTRNYNIKTVVSMNPIMMDGTGMCGACRVMVGNEMKFACVDGPEFDAHKIDFESIFSRVKMYAVEEKESTERFHKLLDDECKLSKQAKEAV
jgi:ferredoxin/flavodoxin---NADP+ reductase